MNLGLSIPAQDNAKARELIFKARGTDHTMTLVYDIDMKSVSSLHDMHAYMDGCGQLWVQLAPSWMQASSGLEAVAGSALLRAVT